MADLPPRRRRSDRLIARPDRWLLGGCVLALVLLVSFVLNDRNIRAQQANDGRVQHTHAVIDALTATQAHLRTAEAVQRRYLITGEPGHLAGFDNAVTEALQAAARVRELTAADRSQHARIPRIEQGIAEVAAIWRDTARVRAAGDATAVQRLVADGPATTRLQDLVAQLEDMTLAERHLLDLRARDAEAAFTTARVTGATTGLASLLLVLSFAGLLKRHLDRGVEDARALRQLSADLREADRRKDRFLATLAHELRNPLAPVRTAAALLTSASLDRDRLPWVADVIRRQVGHMASLLDDLLDVARITQGKLTLRREQARLADVVALAVEAARPLVDRKHHRLAVRLPDGDGTGVVVDADPVRLAQALTNLLTNAAKYSDPGGEITLAAQVRGCDLQLEVCDRGMGIPPQALPHVFEMFSQAEGAAGRSEGGLGIGLALTRGVVELHGGSVQARSGGPGQGSAFVIDLPGVVRTACAAVPAPEATHGGAPPAHSHRILVADDNRDAGAALGALLQVLGHRVQVVDGGRAALQAALCEPPELAFLDIGMPDLDGHEVARALRADAGTRDMVLVAVTGWGQAEDRRHSAASGFDAHLTKPVDPGVVQALLARPLAALRRHTDDATGETAPAGS
jgi:signal transduction histidine kinase/CheY-like chemotaxis protein